jgi:DNA helicase-2/ATP-dependent DNA helicase PcrA
MDFTNRYGKLNAAQKQAVDTIDGPVMVIAGPGTGKTELLSMRAANILKKTDTLPENILCLTFTDSGANAMRERLTRIIGTSAYKVAIHTFHSFGTEVINQNGEFFYHGAHFRAADQLSCYELLRAIFDELDYNNPLSSKMNGEYTHIGDTLSTISELKKSGLTSDELLLVLDANDQAIDIIEPLLAKVFANRLSKTTADQLQPLIKHARDVDERVALPTHVPLSRILADSLEAAINEAHETDSTKPITAWRNAWLKKNETGKFVLKSRDRSTKLRAVSYVYFQYLARMQEAELYDFDDMILRVVHAMEVFPELRFNLQEKYQYIMVDEFQDTNMAQMRILYDLTNNEVNDGQPNILVVGDDDQAIYSFQGADVGNINNFRELYTQTALITLTDNYRSTETVLSQAREVITLGTNRLENYIPELDKTLTAHHKTSESVVTLVELPTINDERTWLTETISQALKEGTPAASIAVLARRHHEIIALLPYFAHAGIKINYERRDNVLDLEIITIIEHISSILVALFEKRHDDADALLPELLAHPSFGINPMDIWRLSLTAKQEHQKWMEVMATTPELQPLHSWLVTQSQSLSHMPLEQMIDEIIGAPKAQQQAPKETHAFVSPLFSYFFSAAKLSDAPDMYLTYLEALRTIRTKLREYLPNETPTLQSFLEFIRMHRQLGSTITNIRPNSERIDDAINLMTAHKSKGLEFDSVFIIGAVDNAWGERVRTRSRLISYPENLPLAPSGDTLDERLRLFFVAMTRARKNLTITYSSSDDNGKNTLRASFLTSDSWQAVTPQLSTTIESLARAAQLMWYQPVVSPLSQDMHALLAPNLERYKLSSTHLNNFLDVTRGGPQMFLMNNLLRFPQAISPSAGYGSAMHATLQRTHAHLSATGKHRPDEDILHDFEENLRAQHLDEKDFLTYLQKGSDAISSFLKVKHSTFTPTQKSELNFAGQNVRLGDAHLTGSLDLVDINEDDRTIIVTDYKTGKAARDWNGKTDYEKIKLHRYKQQLMFYNLLVKHSRDYSKYNFEKGVLQFVEPTPAGDILAIEAQFTTEDLDRFSRLIQKVWQCIIALDLPDVSIYDQSYKGVLAFERALLDE